MERGTAIISCSCCLAGCWAVAAAAGASGLLSVLYPAHAWRQHTPHRVLLASERQQLPIISNHQTLTCSRASAPDRYSSMPASQTHSPSCGQAVLRQAGSHFCFCCKSDVASRGRRETRHPSKVSVKSRIEMVVFLDGGGAFHPNPREKTHQLSNLAGISVTEALALLHPREHFRDPISGRTSQTSPAAGLGRRRMAAHKAGCWGGICM